MAYAFIDLRSLRGLQPKQVTLLFERALLVKGGWGDDHLQTGRPELQELRGHLQGHGNTQRNASFQSILNNF